MRLLVFLLFLNTVSYSQVYKVGAVQLADGSRFKTEAVITVTDSVVVMEGEKSVTYNRLPSTNEMIYLTDGVVNYKLIVGKNPFKKVKGGSYEYQITFDTMERQRYDMLIHYYANTLLETNK